MSKRYDYSRGTLLKNSFITASVFVGLIGCMYVFRPCSATALSPWSLICPTIIALYIVAVLSCLITVIVCKVTDAELMAVSIGTLWVYPLFIRRYIIVHVGLIPIPDRSIYDFFILSKMKQLAIAFLPSLFLIAFGLLLCGFRDTLFTEYASLVFWNYPIYSLVVLLAYASIMVAIFDELMFLNKYIDVRPQWALSLLFLMIWISGAVIITIKNNWNFLKEFLYVGWN